MRAKFLETSCVLIAIAESVKMWCGCDHTGHTSCCSPELLLGTTLYTNGLIVAIAHIDIHVAVRKGKSQSDSYRAIVPITRNICAWIMMLIVFYVECY